MYSIQQACSRHSLNELINKHWSYPGRIIYYAKPVVLKVWSLDQQHHLLEMKSLNPTCCFISWPHAQRAERTKKEADQSRLVGGRGLISKETYLGGLAFRATKEIHVCTHPPNLKSSYRGLTGLNHIFSPGDHNNTLPFQNFILGTAPAVGTVGRASIPRTGEEVMSLPLPRTSLRFNQQSCPLDYLLPHHPRPELESETLQQQPTFWKPHGWFWCTLKFMNIVLN